MRGRGPKEAGRGGKTCGGERAKGSGGWGVGEG